MVHIWSESYGGDKHQVTLQWLLYPAARQVCNQGVILKSQVISTTLIDKNIYMLISTMVSIK